MNIRIKRSLLVVPTVAAIAALAVFLWAGAGTRVVARQNMEGTTVTVHANDFVYAADTETVTAGTVHMVLVNDSKDYTHELWVYPKDQPQLEELLARKRAGEHVEEDEFLQGVAGKVEDVDPGATAIFDVALEPGTYEFACFIASPIAGETLVHYDLGMHVLLTVQAASE